MAPKQNPGKSKQDYCTPPEFLEALKKKLNIEEFTLDVAASVENAVAKRFYTEAEDGLIQPWACRGWVFCNPPFADIEPWVKKAKKEAYDSYVWSAILVPASTGANWWRDYVHLPSRPIFLNGRLAFMPDKPKWLYPKDCAVLLYGDGGLAIDTPYSIWDWRRE